VSFLFINQKSFIVKEKLFYYAFRSFPTLKKATKDNKGSEYEDVETEKLSNCVNDILIVDQL